MRLAAVLWAAAASVQAQEVIAVLSSDLSAYREAHEAFVAAYGPGAGVRNLADGSFSVPRETRLVVAFGRKAAERVYPARVMLIACLAPGLPARWAGSRPAVGISMLPPVEKLLAELKGLQPGLRSLTVVWSSAAFEDYLGRLRQASAAAGISIRSERLDAPDELLDRLRGFVQKTDALWLAPDPKILTEKSFSLISGVGRASGLPVFASAPGLAEKGAVAAVFISYRESGRLAALTALEALKAGELEDPVPAEKITMVLNLAAAKKSGLSIPAQAISRADLVLP